MMTKKIPSLSRQLLALGAAVLLFGVSTLKAETGPAPRITQRIDDSQRTVLKGNTLPIAKAQYDRGAVDPGTPTKRMLLVLKRSDSQEAALKSLIDSMHNPSSPNFHKWLKPEEFSSRFGVASSDVEQVKSWLQAKGFTINKVSKGGTVIDMNGTAGLLKSAFHTELHTYVRHGVTFHANNKDPEIPSALAGVVAGFASLNDYKPTSDMKVLGSAQFDPKTHKVKPNWTYPAGPDEGSYLVPTPADMAVQYNIPSSATGAGETIGIMSASNVDVSIVQNYRTLFGIGSPTNLPQVIVDGDDPGQNGAAVEAYLDVEASAGLAPGAAVNLYVGADTNTTSGLYSAIIRAVDDDVADVMSLSYGTCEADLGTSGNEFFYYVWQQAAAQGQSVFVSAGDGGSAGCDDFDSESEAVDGLAVSGFTSTPYNTSVGGTDFYYSYYYEGATGTDLNNQLATYWNLNSTTTPAVSILTPIPEQPWNNSLGLNIGGYGYGIVAGSGGASSCVTDACDQGYPKPSWQTGTGVPADGVRDVPDTSLFAANGINFSFWPICAAGTDCNTNYPGASAEVNITGVGGTSASSPGTAGIMALIDQSQKGRQGNANFYFYAIAAQDPAAFNDVTNGSNNVICEYGSPDCGTVLDSDGYYDLGEYPATVGYDQASGLGTPNVTKILADWSTISFTPTTTTLALSSTSFAHGTPITANVTVAASGAAVSKGTKANVETAPSGSVALVLSDTNPNAKGQGTIPVVDGAGSGVTVLPGGTYTVTGVYSGDGVFAVSDSSPVSVTVTPEGSTTSLLAYEQDVNDNYTQVTNGGTYAFGDEYAIDADISGVSGNGYASGSVTFYDGTKAIGTALSNSSGVAELNYSNFAPGPHSVTAVYAGDASFTTSTSAALTFTVTQGTSSVFSEDTYDGQGLPVYAGSTFTVPVFVEGNSVYNGEILAEPAAPTGTVTVSFGTQSFTLPLTAQSVYGGLYGTATASFSGFAAGNYTLSVSYSGDTNYTGSTNSYSITVSPASTLLATTTTLTLSTPGGSVSANGGVYATATVSPVVAVTGSNPVPTGNLLFFADGIFLTDVHFSGAPETATVLIPSSYLLNGSNNITAQYLGDSNFAASNSTTATLSVNTGDFALTTSNAPLYISSGSTGSTTFYVSSLQGLGGTVNFACNPSNPALICTVAPNPFSLTPDGTVYPITVTINTHDTTHGLNPTTSKATHMREWLAGGGIVMAFMVLGFPASRRKAWNTRGGLLFTLLLMLGIGFGISGCGGTSNPYGTTTGTNVPAGTYTVQIVATDSGVQHNAQLTVIVQ